MIILNVFVVFKNAISLNITNVFIREKNNCYRRASPEERPRDEDANTEYLLLLLF